MFSSFNNDKHSIELKSGDIIAKGSIGVMVKYSGQYVLKTDVVIFTSFEEFKTLRPIGIVYPTMLIGLYAQAVCVPAKVEVGEMLLHEKSGNMVDVLHVSASGVVSVSNIRLRDEFDRPYADVPQDELIRTSKNVKSIWG